MSNTTRIADLPENIKMKIDDVPNTNYAQMNVHPNPYGNSSQPSVMPPPQDAQFPKNNLTAQLTPEQMAMINHNQQTLPSRDIPMDQTIYQNDEAIQQNYIPPSDTNDFIGEYEARSREHFENYEKEKHRQTVVDNIFDEMQLPIFISTLFFIFQMPIMNTFFSKYFSFLSIQYSDGNPNLYGLLLKSAVFGSVFFSLNKTINYLTII